MPAETILLQDWKTPFEMPPFAAIRDEDFMPAFQEAMRLHLAEVEKVAGNAETPTFANTIEALERAGRGLQKVSSVFFNLASSDTNDERQKIEREISPVLSKHGMAVLTNPKLFARIEASTGGSLRDITSGLSARARCSMKPEKRA